jgi:hypothetical protein
MRADPWQSAIAAAKEAMEEYLELCLKRFFDAFLGIRRVAGSARWFSVHCALSAKVPAVRKAAGRRG